MCYTINLNYYKAYNEKTTVLCSSAAITFSCFFFTFIILNDMLTFLIFSPPSIRHVLCSYYEK